MNSSSVRGSNVAAPGKGSVLSAYAPEFPNPATSDSRCLFLTFSNGFPLSEWQIFNFFDRMFPSHVVDVYVHRPRPISGMVRGKPSLFGKVTFKFSVIPTQVMGPHEKVCFCVDGRPMYCRRFVSQNDNAGSRA